MLWLAEVDIWLPDTLCDPPTNQGNSHILIFLVSKVLKSVIVLERGEDTILIKWSVDELSPDAVARILRSEARFGPFHPITDYINLTQHGEYVDRVPTTHLYRRWYYKFEFKEGERAYVWPEWPLSSEFRGDRVAVAMAADNEIYYRVHGREVIYFPIPTYGTRCPVCFDVVSNKQVAPGCRNCWDTTFAQGYLTPVKVHIMLIGEQRYMDRSYGGSGAVIFGSFPWWVDLRPGSLVVEQENRRWRVGENINRIMKRRVVIYQTCQLIEIPHGKIEWYVPVPEVISERVVGWRYS